MNEPVLINNSQTLSVLLTVLRYALTAAGMWLLVDHKLMSSEELQNLVGSLLTIVPPLWGAYLSRLNLQKQQKMEAALPDSVAHRK